MLPALLVGLPRPRRPTRSSRRFARVGQERRPDARDPGHGFGLADWGIAEVAIIKGGDPATTWQTLASDVQGKIAG